MAMILVKTKNNSGIIVIIVLWIMVILSILTVSLGRHSHIELALLKQSIAKVKSKYVAWSGIFYALEQIRLDTADAESKAKDSLYLCGISSAEGVEPEEIFASKEISDGNFLIQYTQSDILEDQNFYGLQDEERYFNLNGINLQNVNVLIQLIKLLEFDDETAQKVAYSVIDWIDEDGQLSHDDFGAENEWYEGLEKPYRTKNFIFETKEELRLVNGMDEDLYDAISKYLTIYPVDGAFKINFDTAGEVILTALARSLSGAATNTEEADADSLVDKMIDYRSGSDGKEQTSDDREIDLNEMGVNAKERVIFLAMNQFRTKLSNHFRVQVQGISSAQGVKTKLTAVIRRSDLALIEFKSE